MKYVASFALTLVFQLAFTQPNTEVYVADFEQRETETSITHPINVSNNPGYDNQPSFLTDHQLLFSSTRHGQTDIALKNLGDGGHKWLTNTPKGSEYSPLKIPNEDAFSAIRLDKSGLQRLYKHSLRTGATHLLLPDAKVGYHLWYAPNALIATVLIEDRMDLIIANLATNQIRTIEKDVGRSLHKIPKSNRIGFIGKENGKNMIKSLDPTNLEIDFIVDLLERSDDICWLEDGSVLAGSGTSIMRFNPITSKNWELLANFDGLGLANISRIAINPSQKKLAFVAEPSPEHLVQKQVDTFNKGDLDGFVSCFSKEVLVQNFPSDTLYVGTKKMRESYGRFLSKNPNVGVKVVQRIKIGSMVIDEEIGSNNGITNHQVALYTITNGRISSMTFIHDRESTAKPVPIVQQQLDAYNARDIDAFIDTYGSRSNRLSFPP